MLRKVLTVGATSGMVLLTVAARRARCSPSPLADCDNPVCNSKQDMFRRISVGAARKQSSAAAAATESTGAGTGTKVASLECPADRETLGRHTWTLLHTVAAYYPDQPNEVDKRAAVGLVQALAQLYPCLHCRAAFQEAVQEMPPDVKSRQAFSVWVCKHHNEVNRRLDKPEFPCTVEALDERWRRGRPECWETASEPSGETEGETAAESLGQE